MTEFEAVWYLVKVLGTVAAALAAIILILDVREQHKGIK
jgi:hypothetical protein